MTVSLEPDPTTTRVGKSALPNTRHNSLLSPSSQLRPHSPPPRHITVPLPPQTPQEGAPLPEEETSASSTATLAATCSAVFIGISSSAANSTSSSTGTMATKKLKLGSPTETPDEGPSKKRRATNVSHFQEDVGPDQFMCIVFRPTFSRLLIPQDFVKWFGEIPLNIIVKTNTGCDWRMTMMRQGADAYIDQGWAGFAVAHQLKVGKSLIFKKVSSFEYSVVIFDQTCTEVMSRCLYHGDATRCVVFENHV
ncbi:hypothetical protein QYE76_012013 [Lolium multiflorum]|uniref:TF-B3 domain-containing protein n=1 Tax=Lolium multiflorum TaxID=4521 RepID=A0AAD8TWF8_LOLMU|nr:hypothetical protein QYE76_012013 [Lolium multiflorum]